MRIPILALVIVILCMPVGVSAFTGAPEVGDPFPMFSGMTVDGYLFELEDFLYGDMFIFVDFWATWCEPCKTEMPNVIESWLDYGGDELMVVGINLDEPKNMRDVYEYISEMEISFPVINDYTGITAPLSVDLMVDYIPQSYLLAPDGTVLLRDLKDGELSSAIEVLMEMQANPGRVEIDVTIVDDPREQPGFLTPDIVDEGHLVNPDPLWLYDRPDELVFNIFASSEDLQIYPAILRMSVCRPTGKSTHMISDEWTKEVYRSEIGMPYVFWEVQHEFIEKGYVAEEGVIIEEYVLPLPEDTFEVTWELAVYSMALDDYVVSRKEIINFPCLYYITEWEVSNQGGYFRAD